MMTSITSLLLHLSLLLGPSLALILREVTLPAYIVAGDRTSLGCHYDTQGEQIYSVKWYKGGREIFRYQPSLRDRPISVYRRPGVHISQVSPGLAGAELSIISSYRRKVTAVR